MPTPNRRGVEKDGCFVTVVSLLSCGCLYFVPIPRSAVDWLCDKFGDGFSWERLKLGDVLTWRRLNFDLTG